MGESDATLDGFRRNEPCWCGSGRTYKKCHGTDPDAVEREQRQRQQFVAALRDQVNAGWQIDSESVFHAEVSRRRFGIFAQHRIIKVTAFGEVSIERL